MKGRNIYGIINRAVAVVLVVAIAALSSGCSFLRNLFTADMLSFSRHTVTLQVGDTFDILTILETDTDSYTVSSSDSSVAEIDEDTLVITARAVGTAHITAETSSASDKLKVVVTEKEQDAVLLSSSGELVQTVGKTSLVRFSATATGAPASSDTVYWYVNDRLVKLHASDESFEYTPSGVGEFIITAKCGDVTSDGITVRVFNAVTAEVEVKGELTQDDPFTDIVFTVTVSGTDEKSYFQYYEDSKILYEGNLSTYAYKPTAGRHTLSVKVNGQTAYETQAYFRGAVAPTVDSELLYDNMYPHAYLRYDAIGKVKVEITSPYGTQEYSQTDSKYADLFDENGFDVGGLIELCATGAVENEYKFRVKSLGDDDAITESEYSAYVTYKQLPEMAQSYLKNVLPCGDLYVTSEIEYVRIVEYYVFFREKTANSSVKFNCYIGYDRSGSAKELWDEAFPIAATSGVYSGINVYDESGVMHTEFKVDTVNNPTKQLSGGTRSAQLHAVLPHINYDENKYRPASYAFPIDRITRTAEVEYSDELYLAVQNGVRPVPKTGSSASTVYQKARDILRMICTDDMTEVQKAHAIYDWIMWQVTYDTPATKLDSGSEEYSAYYLEGVFGDGKTYIGNVVYKPYAVCDGMSKAYSLLCNIEGIPCVRVVGRAGKSLRTAGGHAWNKVYLGGAWYLVDCTWGDSHVTFALDGASREYELGLHSHLFVTDAMTSGTHFEPYRYDGKTTIRYAPQTAKTPLNVYTDMTVNGVKINCYIAKNENEQTRMSEIAAEFAKAYAKRNTITVPGGENGGVYSVDYQAIEINSENGFSMTDNAVANTVTKAIQAVHRNAKVKVLTLEDTLLVLMKA